MSRTRRLVRSLTEERGYTIRKLVGEAVERGYGTRGEAASSLRKPLYSCPAFVPALEDILKLSAADLDTLFVALREDAEVELQHQREAA